MSNIHDTHPERPLLENSLTEAEYTSIEVLRRMYEAGLECLIFCNAEPRELCKTDVTKQNLKVLLDKSQDLISDLLKRAFHKAEEERTVSVEEVDKVCAYYRRELLLLIQELNK